MAFEDEMIRSTLDEFLGGEKGSLAIDVGCGNGRHSRVLASHFADVVAFDLSEKMVTAARKKDEKQLPANVKAVTYWECDIEYEAFPDEGDVQGSADFVCASFGMPSFVEDTVAFIRRVYKWLRPGGLALFTFYNSESVALTVETPWKERALSASIDLSRHALDVEIREDRHFSIYCRAFDDRIRDLVKSAFTVRREVTFPHVMAIMPPSVFGTDEYPRVVARDVFPRIDRAIASEKIPGRGHYVFLVLEKVDNRSDGYFRVIETLNKSGVEHEIIAHKEIVSASEAQNELGLLESQMVKTVVFKRIDTGGFLVALVPGKARAEMTALAEAGRLEPSQLVLAPAQEVETVFGFPIGGVSPVGYDSSVAVFVDGSLIESEEPWLYMGVGDNRKTLKITKSAFLRLIEGYSPARLIGT
jgi:prolyl-tRNA editing enzyme YbaK/EbsC (Cys-tRNA(Pro) deacylase)/ubiquinone/menaquinone biosynthesis C-methylase UbiE